MLWPPPAVWTPQPGPQTLAYDCLADELFYGGSAGGGKSDLLLGLAGTVHTRSVIFRREFPMFRSLIERSRELFNARGESHLKDSYNESLHVWRLHDGRMVEFASMQHEHDKQDQQGRDRDFFGWDEITHFTESQFRFANAWCRSARPGQRCRIVATGNPPTSSEGEWVLRYWAPWLEPTHHRPARPGELRWFIRAPGADRDEEVENGDLLTIKGEVIQPRSRTFIPARLTDNPILAGTGYGAMLQGLPEPLRSQMLYGDFSIGIGDDAWQVIPTAWVRAAQARWTRTPPALPLSCLGVDVAHGGADATVIVVRHGPWFAMPLKFKGVETDSGDKAAALVLRAHGGGPQPINIDAIGYGSSACDFLKLPRKDQPALNVNPINNALPTDLADRSGQFRLVNVRAASYWKLREALDPIHGDNLALPPDPEVLADLCAPRFKLTAAGIQIEPKVDLAARLGRSPDVGDAIVLAHWQAGAGPWQMGPARGAESPFFRPPPGVFRTGEGRERELGPGEFEDDWRDDPLLGGKGWGQ